MAKSIDALAGTLELIVLKTLTRGPNHGFGVTLHVQNASEGLLSVEEGSLYPALHRLERAGLIRGEWRVTENSRRARFYALTPKGRKRLSEVEAHWINLSKGVSKILRYA